MMKFLDMVQTFVIYTVHNSKRLSYFSVFLMTNEIHVNWFKFNIEIYVAFHLDFSTWDIYKKKKIQYSVMQIW